MSEGVFTIFQKLYLHSYVTFRTFTHPNPTYMEKKHYQAPAAEVYEIGIENTILITSDPFNNPNSDYDPLNDLGLI